MYKVKKREGGWHAVSKTKWTAMICGKRASAKLVCDIFNILDFDNITDSKLAKKVHDLSASLAEHIDSQ